MKTKKNRKRKASSNVVLSEESAEESESEITKWKDSEIELILNHIQENYSAWSSGNKTKFYEAMANNVLSQYTGEQIKNKIGGVYCVDMIV